MLYYWTPAPSLILSTYAFFASANSVLKSCLSASFHWLSQFSSFVHSSKSSNWSFRFSALLLQVLLTQNLFILFLVQKIFDHIRVMRYTRTFFGYSSVFSLSFLIFVCIFRSLLLESEKYSLRVGPHSVTISVSCPFSLSISFVQENSEYLTYNSECLP